jgi:heme oxygenase
MSHLHQLLKIETAGIHEQLDTLPFFVALRAGSLPKLAIVNFLRCLSIIHSVVERNLSQISSLQIDELAKGVPPKVPLLVADLETLGAANLPSVTAGIRSALDYAAEILVHADNPLSLVGILYVLEGSQNGGIALRHAYTNCVGLTKEQLSYFGCYGSESAARWAGFAEYLDALLLRDEHAAQVVHFALQCFERLRDICAALYPFYDKDLQHHVAAINFEAGDHAMPQNPLEIALALRAGRAAWKKYPYLERRFGERGKRFTSSDSCWLVALLRSSEATATKSLEWLRAVLASRGIPSVILEGHLLSILQLLAAEFPDQIEIRTRFDRFLSGLETERRGLGGIEPLSHLIAQFNRRFHGCSGLTVDSAASLIASAWIDERYGITGSLTAVQDWFVESERFSDDWIAAVDDLVATLDRAGKSPC